MDCSYTLSFSAATNYTSKDSNLGGQSYRLPNACTRAVPEKLIVWTLAFSCMK